MLPPDSDEAVPIRTHEVRHRLAPQVVAMKPNAAVEGEAHALVAACKLPIRAVYEQEMWPSTVALPTGVALPEKR